MKKRIFAFIQKKYLCTICSTDGNQPWANTFYYVFDAPNRRLIYVTSTDTHHAHLMANNPNVAGTIFSPTRFNPSLQGVQFIGKAHQLEGAAAEEAKTLYKKEYQHELIDSLSVWEVVIEYTKMVDHTLGFYSKLEWHFDKEDEIENLEQIRKYNRTVTE